MIADEHTDLALQARRRTHSHVDLCDAGSTSVWPRQVPLAKVEVHDHDTMDQGEYWVHAGLRRWLEDWAAAWSEFSMEPEEFLDVGEHVVMFVRMKATGVSSGLTLERQDAMVFAVRDGKVVRLDYRRR